VSPFPWLCFLQHFAGGLQHLAARVVELSSQIEKNPKLTIARKRPKKKQTMGGSLWQTFTPALGFLESSAMLQSLRVIPVDLLRLRMQETKSLSILS